MMKYVTFVFSVIVTVIVSTVIYVVMGSYYSTMSDDIKRLEFKVDELKMEVVKLQKHS